MTGVRFSTRIQGMFIAGALASHADRPTTSGATVNPSLFYQLSRKWTAGAELGHRFEPEQRSYALPQLHVNPFDAFALKLQVGAGAELVGTSTGPLLAIRFAVER